MRDIFGYSWETIRNAQQGGSLNAPIKHVGKPGPTEKDIEMLKTYGAISLERKEMWGILDRLKTGGLI